MRPTPAPARRPGPGPLSVLAWAVFLFLGLAVAFFVTVRWPQLLAAGILIAVFVLAIAMLGLGLVAGQRWLPWVMIPAFLLTGLGALMLAEDLAIDRDGEAKDVVVSDHTVTSDWVHSGNVTYKRYEHEYTLQGADGRRIEQSMIYRGKNGYDGLEKGARTTVLLDPDGKAPPQPLERVDPGAGLGILIVGGVLSTGTLIACASVLAVRRSRARAGG